MWQQVDGVRGNSLKSGAGLFLRQPGPGPLTTKLLLHKGFHGRSFRWVGTWHLLHPFAAAHVSQKAADEWVLLDPIINPLSPAAMLCWWLMPEVSQESRRTCSGCAAGNLLYVICLQNKVFSLMTPRSRLVRGIHECGIYLMQLYLITQRLHGNEGA